MSVNWEGPGQDMQSKDDLENSQPLDLKVVALSYGSALLVSLAIWRCVWLYIAVPVLGWFR